MTSNDLKENYVPLVELTVAITILHVALHDNLVIVKGHLVAMVLTIP